MPNEALSAGIAGPTKEATVLLVNKSRLILWLRTLPLTFPAPRLRFAELLLMKARLPIGKAGFGV